MLLTHKFISKRKKEMKQKENTDFWKGSQPIDGRSGLLLLSDDGISDFIDSGDCSYKERIQESMRLR